MRLREIVPNKHMPAEFSICQPSITQKDSVHSMIDAISDNYDSSDSHSFAPNCNVCLPRTFKQQDFDVECR